MKTKILTAVFTIAFLSIFSLSAQEHDHSNMKKDTTKMEMNHSKMDASKIGVKTMYVCPMHAEIKSNKPGTCSICKMDLKKVEMKASSEKMKQKNIEKSYFTCPMHASVKSDKAGECPKCHMALVEKKIKKEDLKK